jgi:hypothetical protein
MGLVDVEFPATFSPRNIRAIEEDLAEDPTDPAHWKGFQDNLKGVPSLPSMVASRGFEDRSDIGIRYSNVHGFDREERFGRREQYRAADFGDVQRGRGQRNEYAGGWGPSGDAVAKGGRLFYDNDSLRCDRGWEENRFALSRMKGPQDIQDIEWNSSVLRPRHLA